MRVLNNSKRVFCEQCFLHPYDSTVSVKGNYTLFFCSLKGIPGEPLAAASEQEIFELIGKDYVKPNERNL